MVEKWKLALKEFLKDYEENDDVVGAVLCGSYATGNEDDKSDVDVYLILKDSCDYQIRGNTECNSYLIEYFIEPKYKIKESMENEHNNYLCITANMLAYGKIIYDLDGSAKELQDLALTYVDKPYGVITNKKLGMNNYLIWDLMDELKGALDENRLDFLPIYYKLLRRVYEAYSEYESLSKLPNTKIYKILTCEEYRKKYHVFNFPDEEFTKLYIKCYEVDKTLIMYKNILNLVNYYYEKQGGFNIRTFELKTKLS